MNLVEKELCSMNSFQAVSHVLNGFELHPFQCIDVMKMLYRKRAVVVYDTGTGKTLLAAAFIKLLCNEDPNRRFIMFVKKDQLIQTPQKLSNACGKTVLTSTADAKHVSRLLSVGMESATVLMLTHDCLDNDKVMNALFACKDAFCGVIFDEAHELSNFSRAYSASVAAGLSMAFEYCIALTATPITTDVLQLAKLAYVVDRERYPDYVRLERQLKNRSFDIRDDPMFFISRNGEDFGGKRNYHGIIEWVEPMPHQKRDVGGDTLARLCKGDGAYHQANALVSVVKRYAGKRGLIYVERHEIRRWLEPFLDAADISYDCINGHTGTADRRRIMSEFNEDRKLDVVITSITTAIDLDCDYVVFYEFTVLVKQMIGRAHRGLGDKDMDVIFMITMDTCEVEYFYNNILSISFVIRDIMHKDYSELEDVERCLEGEHVRD